jgi:hypothetical protein
LATLVQGEGGGNIAELYVSPADFEETGAYQEFTISFALDEIVPNVQLWIDYVGGSSTDWADTDLYVDAVVVTREGGLALPEFIPIHIGLVGPIDPLDEDLRMVTGDYEAAGGLVLHPDEFMAALNPEFMIEWAEPILGSGHPALVDARVQLEDGEFLTSLLSVREALRTPPEQAYQFEEGAIVVKANTWVTDLALDRNANWVSFETHGPPEGIVRAAIQILDNSIGPVSVVEVDGQRQEATISLEGSQTVVALEFGQGPHRVVVSAE